MKLCGFLSLFRFRFFVGTVWFLISCPDSYFFLVQCGFLSLAQIHTIFRTVWFLISCPDSYYFWYSVVSYLLPRFILFLGQCGFLSLAQIHTIFGTVWFLISCPDFEDNLVEKIVKISIFPSLLNLFAKPIFTGTVS